MDRDGAAMDEQAGTTFVSYASADRHDAFSICEELEARGARCWIAARDVRPGENYQEAIVHAIRTARALVLVFSEHANRSDEIKKELSLASRFRVPVIAARIADVEPSDAFAYELSTRQWIDLFADRTRALGMMAARIGEVGRATTVPPDRTPPAPPSSLRTASARSRPRLVATLAGLIAVAGGAGWFAAHRGAAPASGASALEVRLTGFERLSPDLPAGTDAAMRDELTAALSDEGVVKVSNAGKTPAGTGPAFAIGGTLHRDGGQVRVVLRLVNERSGTTLWSQSIGYDVATLSSVPRLVAANAGSVLRCGLFGASTYSRALPDGALADYLTECQHHYSFDSQPSKSLDAARKVVAAVPDFSWGWSGVAVSAAMTARTVPPASIAPLLREAIAAADRAVALDPTNSEALARKSLAIDSAALAEREALLKQALRVRALSCGCEHNIYAGFLDEVGRGADALAQHRRAVDTLALEWESQEWLAVSLAMAGNEREAQQHVDAAVQLTGDTGQRSIMALILAPIDHDYPAAIAGLGAPTLTYGKPVLAAWRVALQALAAGPAGDRATGIAALAALPDDGQETVVTVGLLGALGANREALGLIERRNAGPRMGSQGVAFPAEHGRRARRPRLRATGRAARTDPLLARDEDPPGCVCRRGCAPLLQGDLTADATIVRPALASSLQM